MGVRARLTKHEPAFSFRCGLATSAQASPAGSSCESFEAEVAVKMSEADELTPPPAAHAPPTAIAPSAALSVEAASNTETKEQRIGYVFNDKAYLRSAVTHASG